MTVATAPCSPPALTKKDPSRLRDKA